MNNPARILIIDDEPSIRFVLKHALKHEGYIINTATNGVEALNILAETPQDLLLLDLYMEPIDGLQVLNVVKEQDPDIAVIIITAHSSVESAVEALRLGAFDYLFKPTTPDTVRQRVEAGLQHRRQALQQRRLLTQIETLRLTLNDLNANTDILAPPAPNQRFINSGSLVIDNHHRLITLNGILLDLTTSEFDVLLCLVKAAPKPLAPRQLVSCAMGYDVDEVEARDIIKWHIHQLRRKVEPDKQPRYIKTVRNKGYLWSGEYTEQT